MWSEQEEQAFAKIMQAGELDKMSAVRLYRRCGSDLERALASIERDNLLAGRVPYALQNWEARKLATKRS